jgi:N-acetylmuramoyl-L-alanine amidase
MNEAYPRRQIVALANLLNHLVNVVPGLCKITGHENLDTNMLVAEDDPDKMIRRKVDPGPLFPWGLLMESISLERISTKDL